MEQRLSLVTLGVRDRRAARAFYEALGWRSDAGPDDDVVFFQTGCMIVALWGRARLAEDSGVTDGGGWGGVTLAYNAGSPDEVDAVIESARGAGASIARAPGDTFWGGYAAVFVDPEGHPWEVAHNPGWRLDADWIDPPDDMNGGWRRVDETRRPATPTRAVAVGKLRGVVHGVDHRTHRTVAVRCQCQCADPPPAAARVVERLTS